MSELAFNVHGENFEVPAVVRGWRVRRLKPRGAPELVYGRDGLPLTLAIDSDIADLREAVDGVVGRYRLDPVNDDGKHVETAPAAYIQVVKAEQPEEPAPRVPTKDDVLREAMRLNTELARAVVDRFPEMMKAAAEVLRAADGAGMPSRRPELAPIDHDNEAASPTIDFGAIVQQLLPGVMAAVAAGRT